MMDASPASPDRDDTVVPFSAVVPAAGVGQRFGAAVPKQYLHIGGRTVLEHSVGRLLALPELQHLVLVVAAEDPLWQGLSILRDPRVRVATGGELRVQSVIAGLDALAGVLADDAWLMVHDVARPCVSARDLRRLFNELGSDPVGGLLGLPVSDTVKQVADGRVTATVDRRQVWRALTPQLFRFRLLRDALVAALVAGREITDESSAVEYAGHRPRIVAGSRSNIKITEPGDLELAAFYLQQHLQEDRG